MVADVYLELREMILRGDPSAHGWLPDAALPRVWGALVEVGLAAGPATLVTLRDGTTSLYLGNGSATIGAGEAGPVADAAHQLLTVVDGALEHLSPVWEFPLPEPRQVRIVALTFQGPYGAAAWEAELADDRHPLAAIFTASGAVLAEIDRLEAALPDEDRADLC